MERSISVGQHGKHLSVFGIGDSSLQSVGFERVTPISDAWCQCPKRLRYLEASDTLTSNAVVILFVLLTPSELIEPTVLPCLALELQQAMTSRR